MKKLNTATELNVIFTTRNIKTFLPKLKSGIEKHLQCLVVYQITCSGCNSTSVAQTCIKIATRIPEHQKTDTPIEESGIEFCGSSRAFEWSVIDQCNDSQKLMTLEAIYIAEQTPAFNTRGEYRSSELTLKY